jgi:Plasmid pRiA4b ORF-3-like protein.
MHSLFPAGSRLLAKITALEEKRGILIIGHRLEPYRSVDVAPWDVRLSTEGGNNLSSRLVPVSFEDAAIFFCFFGQEELFPLLAAQDKSNAKTLASAADPKDAIIRIKAFDSEDLFAANGLTAGDYVEFELADDTGERFTVRPLKAAEIPSERRADWFRGLDRGREAAMRELGRPVDPADFIAAIFSSAPASVREEPAAAFSEYYNRGDVLQIKSFAGRSFMWTNGIDIVPLISSGSAAGGNAIDDQDDLDELSRNLADNGFALDSTELTAFVRDALWRGETIEKAIDRCFSGAGELGIPQKRLDALLDEAREFSRGVERDWKDSREEPEAAKIRSAFLDIYTPFLLWMRRMSGIVTSPSQLDTEEFDILSGVMQNICDLIHILAEGQKGESDGLADMRDQVPMLAQMTRELMDSIEADIEKAKRKKRAPAPARKKGKERPAAEKCYLLEIRIADIEPAIRRQVLVPGNRSLGDLHTIIQDAFGWTDSHLHAFRIRGDVFGVPSPEDFEPVIDERRVRLDELALRGRSKFEYTYDFGDDWQHEIVVVAARKKLADIDYPCCLEAARARPPEDCGGFPGYLRLLEILAKPEGNRDEEETQFIAWCGGAWDPERCDPVEINKALAKD